MRALRGRHAGGAVPIARARLASSAAGSGGAADRARPLDAGERRPRRRSRSTGRRSRRVASGAVVRIDTLSQRGATQQEDPVAFLGKLGVKPDEILQDVRGPLGGEERRPQDERGGGGHILTGPIYVEGAAPGDTLAVEMLELTTRVPYGINATSSTGGVFSRRPTARRRGDRRAGDSAGTIHLIRTGIGARPRRRVLLRHDSGADEPVHGHDGRRAG